MNESDKQMSTPSTDPIIELPTDGPKIPQENSPVDDAAPAQGQTGRRVLINTGALAGSSVWRIGTSFILQLFIARQLGIVGMGHYTVALAYLNVCQVLSELGLQTLLVRDLAQRPARRRGYFFASLGLQLGASLLIWGALIGITRLLPFAEETRVALLLVGASLPFYAVTSAIQTIFQAGEQMELVMGVEMFINTLIVVLSLTLLWMGYGLRELVAVLVVTQAVSALLCWLFLRRTTLLAAPQESMRGEWFSLPKRAAPFYALALADVLLHRIDILLLGILAGELITGIYSAAYNVVRVLMKVIQSYWKALYPTLSRLLKQHYTRYDQLCALSQRYGFFAMLLGTLAAGTIAEQLMNIYGKESAGAAPVFSILIWLSPIFLLESYAILVLMVEGKPLQSLWTTAAHLLAISILLPLFTLQFRAVGAAWAALIATGTGATVGLILLRKFALPLEIRKIILLIAAALLTLLSMLVLQWFWAIPWLLHVPLVTLLFIGFSALSGTVSKADLITFRRAFIGNSSPTGIIPS